MEPITHLKRLEDVTGTVKRAAADAANVDSEIDETSEIGPHNSETHVFLHRDQVDATQSFDEFYRAHAGSVGQALELTLGDRELAEDALNEGMARALQRWKRVARFDNPEGWVYRVAMNWAPRHRRATGRAIQRRESKLLSGRHQQQPGAARYCSVRRRTRRRQLDSEWRPVARPAVLDVA